MIATRLVASNIQWIVVDLPALWIVSLLWIISIPASLLGSYRGLRRPRMTIPGRVNQIPRAVPGTKFSLCMRSLAIYTAAGIYGFALTLTPLDGLLAGKGNQPSLLAILAVSCLATTFILSISHCWWIIQREEYRWWWKAMLTPATMALPATAYAGLFFTPPHAKDASVRAAVWLQAALVSSFMALILGKKILFYSFNRS